MPDLRDLPAVDLLLNATEMVNLVDSHGIGAVRDEIRLLQSRMRAQRKVPDWAIQAAGYVEPISKRLHSSRYTPVFNMTGTVIHTNLGRALLSDTLWQAVQPLVTRPMNLEYDIAEGQRGDRDAIVEARICRLTGCEAATVVNNNAAALMLCLNTFAQGRKVPVSRGELIEIGGSFRLPELMARSGCELLEVGTTNRTHGKDFAEVLDQAAMLLKVHPSNYYISGFAQDVQAAELAQLAQQADIPSCVDLGSGTLVDLTRWNLPAEPTPQSVLKEGIDLVTFSGDKLLGGVQAGIIVGKKNLLAQIKTNPMKRAMRADKITLAVLDATLKLYEQPDELPQHLPLLKTLTTSLDELRKRGDALRQAIPTDWHTELRESDAQIGSGALPDKTIKSLSLILSHPDQSAEQIAIALRMLPTPVICRIAENRVWLDLRGAQPLQELIQQLQHLAP
ncbi:MAG: L-seryl-tRNA(Sec) selenium transferase [bacterium]